MKKCLSLVVVIALILSSLASAPPPRRGRLAAMTFDDGPSAVITPWLLDELAQKNVKCTFFVLGSYAKLYPETVLRAHNEGHQIASHTYNHYALSAQSDYVIQGEVEGTRELLESITGESSFMVRLPYGDGEGNGRVLGCINAPVILWSVDPTNGRYPISEEQLYRGILNQVQDGGIILMHDTSAENLRAALRAIDTLQAQGYSFVTVEELFRLKGVTPQNNVVYKRIEDAGDYYDESRLNEHWAYSAINDLSERGVMRGDGDGFKPNEYLTRAMAVTLMWRVAGEPDITLTTPFTRVPVPGRIPDDETGGFGDVSEDSWYYNAVAWGRKTGILTGYSEEVFAPLELASREQFCVMIARMAQNQHKNLPSGAVIPVYGDMAGASGWALDVLQQIWGAGFVSANETASWIYRRKEQCKLNCCFAVA